MASSEMIRYCVTISRKEEVCEGPEDASVVITVSAADAADLDPTTAFMLGKLKTQGSTGALFRGLRSGEVATTLRRIVQGLAAPGSR